MLPRPRAACVGAVLTLCLTLTTLAAAAADAGREGGSVVGPDGTVYPAAPAVVPGRHGQLFYGNSFNHFCADDDGEFTHALDQLSRLSRVIRASGREVVFTVVPDKAQTMPHEVIRSELPHGRCDLQGMRHRRQALDHDSDPSYLPIRRVLADDPGQVFWKTDVHWTSVGSASYVRALAGRLDPALAARQTFRRSAPETALMPMAEQVGRTEPETVPSLRPHNPVRAHQTKGSLDFKHSGFPAVLSWRSQPKQLTWPGRTVLLGDSFTCLAVRNLRPAFSRATFLWIGYVDQDVIDRTVARADTVVIQIAEFLLTTSSLTTDAFRRSVRRELEQ